MRQTARIIVPRRPARRRADDAVVLRGRSWRGGVMGRRALRRSGSVGRRGLHSAACRRTRLGTEGTPSAARGDWATSAEATWLGRAIGRAEEARSRRTEAHRLAAW
eukprot:2247006-Pyramimonas_sp.AAC.2